jgi:ABC-type sugar transport system substrate-binding protein
MKRSALIRCVLTVLTAATAAAGTAQAQQKKPNILVIMTDDVGI